MPDYSLYKFSVLMATLTCENPDCGITFTRNPSQSRHEHKYCSRKCSQSTLKESKYDLVFIQENIIKLKYAGLAEHFGVNIMNVKVFISKMRRAGAIIPYLQWGKPKPVRPAKIARVKPVRVKKRTVIVVKSRVKPAIAKDSKVKTPEAIAMKIKDFTGMKYVKTDSKTWKLQTTK